MRGLMITRKALDDCLVQATEELKDAPPHGMLAYLMQSLNRGCSFSWTDREVQVIALAYVYAVRKEEGR
jgi:hypothetical protein